MSGNLQLCLKNQFHRDVFLGNLWNFSNSYSQKLHILAVWKIVVVFNSILWCYLFDTALLFKKLSPKKKMWYFYRQSIQFFEPGEYCLALSSITHSSDISMFFFLWSHMKLGNSVGFCLLQYLKVWATMRGC